MYWHEQKNRRYRPVVWMPYPAEARDLSASHVVRRYLESRGLSSELARANGWYPSRYWGGEVRIVIPAVNTAGYPYWQARALHPHPPRYVSPPIPRGDSVVVVFPQRPPSGRREIIIVEGPMDALAVASQGLVSVALMGARPPLCVYDALARRWQCATYIVIPDSDAPAGGVRSVRELVLRGRHAELRVLPAGVKDFAELPAVERRRVLCLD